MCSQWSYWFYVFDYLGDVHAQGKVARLYATAPLTLVGHSGTIEGEKEA